MQLFELFEREDTALQFRPRVGATRVQVIPTPDEKVMFDQAGISADVDDMYVVHAYLEPIAGNLQVQDQLKLRGEYENNVKAVNDVIATSIQTVLKTIPQSMDRKWEQTRTAVQIFQQWMTSPTVNFVIVPLPSSSPVPMMIAKQLAHAARGKVSIVPALKKNPYPELDKTMIGDRVRSAVDYAGIKRNYERLKDQIDRAIEQGDDDTFERLEPAYAAAETQFKKLKPFSRKSHMVDSASLYGKAYYNTVQTDTTMNLNDLKGAAVVFVDDNIISGHTVADAIKDLLYNGIKPKYMIGFVPHRFDSVRL